MSGTISLLFGSLSSAVKSLQHVAEETDPSTGDIPAITSDAQTLRRYEQTIRDIGNLLQQYQRLVERDCTSLNAVHDNMLNMDEFFASNFSLHPWGGASR